MDLQTIQTAIVTIIGSLLTYLAGQAAAQVKSYLNRKKITEKIKIYESSARIAVTAVEQIYKNENGPAKFELAKKRLATDLTNKGFTTSDADLQFYIESVVQGLKTGWFEVAEPVEEETKDVG